MKKKYLISLGGIIAFIAALVFAMTQVHIVRSGSITPTPTPTHNSQFTPNGMNGSLRRPTPTPPKVTDLSPNVADIDKARIIILHADGSREDFLVAPEDIDAFIKQLPAGDTLFGINPPPSIMAPFYTPGP